MATLCFECGLSPNRNIVGQPCAGGRQRIGERMRPGPRSSPREAARRGGSRVEDIRVGLGTIVPPRFSLWARRLVKAADPFEGQASGELMPQNQAGGA